MSMQPQRHLRRLECVWVDRPIYFVTSCTLARRQELATAAMHAICREVWTNCEERYGWRVGRYVVMPDHVHFFCASSSEKYRLEKFVGKWKEWTAKYSHRRLGKELPLWQEEFFDHLLRSPESYEEKWRYVRENPVRANLVVAADQWPYQGEIHDLRYD